jgi:hypothetical protein
MAFPVLLLIRMNEWFWNCTETMFKYWIRWILSNFLWNDGNVDVRNWMYSFE